MRTAFILLLGAVIGTLVAFLGGAFVQWSLDPAQWSMNARAVVALVAALIASIGVVCD